MNTLHLLFRSTAAILALSLLPMLALAGNPDSIVELAVTEPTDSLVATPTPEPVAMLPVSLKATDSGNDCWLAYSLPEARLATITVRNSKGDLIRFLQVGGQANFRNLPLNLDDSPAGTYKVKLEAGNAVYELQFTKQ